jgi:hypothetical protein
VRTNIANGSRATAHPDPKRLRKAVQRTLREAECFESFEGKRNIHRETGAALFRPSIDALAHIAQPDASSGGIRELEKDVAPIPHQDGRHDIVLGVVQVVFQVSGSVAGVAFRASLIAVGLSPLSQPIAPSRYA